MSTDIQLDAHEARVLGVLIEKELTTPEQYPLTLNSLTLGANQKSNRDPVVEFADSQVYAAVQRLIRKGLVGSVHPVGARVEKFRHNGESVLQVGRPQIAALAELLLRGAQQPGELRARVARMVPVPGLNELMEILNPLLERGIALRLAPTPGSRAERYAQTLSPSAHPLDVRAEPRALAPSSEVHAADTHTRAQPAASAPVSAYAIPITPKSSHDPRTDEHAKRIEELEANVSRLRRQLDHLAWRLGEKLDA